MTIQPHESTDSGIVIFGAGSFGLEAAKHMESKGIKVIYFIDNNPNLHGTFLNGIEIISLDKYIDLKINLNILVACNYMYQCEIATQLKNKDITNFSMYFRETYMNKKRLFSNCPSTELEDVILYHLFKDDDDVFYIDIGSCDPTIGSVTKILYEKKNAYGINIEPQKTYIEFTEFERPRDINLCVGVGAKEELRDLYIQYGGSTMFTENLILGNGNKTTIRVVPLKKICDQYVKAGQKISFLKVDVEGAEKEVLLGADFKEYRPYIIVMESTIPRTDIPCYEKWEHILIDNDYHFAYSRGINRYYVANECTQYDEKIKQLDHLDDFYSIYHSTHKYIKTSNI